MKRFGRIVAIALSILLIASCTVLALVACEGSNGSLGAYVLTDKGTFLSYKKNAEGDKLPNLEILYEKSEDMKNIYSMEAIVGTAPEGVTWSRTINTKGADSFIHWMSTAATRAKIAEYGKTEYGENLFSLIEDSAVVYSGAVETFVAGDEKVVKAQTTSSVKDSGLLVYLEGLYETDTGFDLQVSAAATGTAITNAKNGDADMILVHSAAQEKAFIDLHFTRTVSGIANTSAEVGYESRITFMYNYFVIAGNAQDPAAIKAAANAADAFKLIKDGGFTFVGRADNSGTNSQEIKLWKAAGVTDISWDKENSILAYNSEYTWYVASKAKMGECLILANETAFKK